MGDRVRQQELVEGVPLVRVHFDDLLLDELVLLNILTFGCLKLLLDLDGLL